MAASQKAIDNAQRLRYIRALERFHRSMDAYLANTTELTKERFVKKVDNAMKLLNRVEPIALYKGELQELALHVKKIITLKSSEKSMDDIKDTIIYASNQLAKSKNAKRYKKDKHNNSKFEDWE